MSNFSTDLIDSTGNFKNNFLKPNFENIPQYLKALNQWLLWVGIWNGSKFDKIPINPKTGYKGRTNDPATWNNFSVAAQAFTSKKCIVTDSSNKQITIPPTGIGIAFNQGDDLCGIDIDHCGNSETDEIEPWAEEIIQHFHKTGVSLF